MSESVAAAIVGGIIGNVIVLVWSLWPVIVDVRWHGFDNHFCRRAGCCR